MPLAAAFVTVTPLWVPAMPATAVSVAATLSGARFGECHGERMCAAVGARERIVGGQCRRRIARAEAEMHDAGVAGRGIVGGILGGDADGARDARNDRGGEAGKNEARRRARIDPLGEGRRGTGREGAIATIPRGDVWSPTVSAAVRNVAWPLASRVPDPLAASASRKLTAVPAGGVPTAWTVAVKVTG